MFFIAMEFRGIVHAIWQQSSFLCPFESQPLDYPGKSIGRNSESIASLEYITFFVKHPKTDISHLISIQLFLRFIVIDISSVKECVDKG